MGVLSQSELDALYGRTPKPDDAHRELNSALNPVRNNFDVLANQEIRKEEVSPSGIHDLSEIPLEKRPTNLEPGAPAVFEAPVSPEASVEVKKKYEVNPHLVGYVSYLIGRGRKLKTLEFELGFVQSEDDLRHFLKHFYMLHRIDKEEYLKMIDILDYPDEQDPLPSARQLEDSPKVESVPVAQEMSPEIVVPEETPEQPQQTEKPVQPEKPQTPQTTETAEITPPQNTITPEATPAPESQEALDPIDAEVIRTRASYAQAQIEHRSKNSKFKKIKGLLKNLITDETSGARSGKEKTQTELELESAKEKLDQALAEYLEAKKEKAKKIYFDFIDEESKKDEYKIMEKTLADGLLDGKARVELLALAGKEWDELQEKISELTPRGNETVEKIKERLGKAYKVWQKVPLPIRLSIVPLIIGGALALAPMAGLAGGVTAGVAAVKIRTARAAVGAAASRSVGTAYQGSADRTNERAMQEYTSEYKTGITPDSFEEKEKQYMEARESESKRKKAQAVKKALLMVGAGAGTGILAGMALGTELSSGAHASADSVNLGKPTLPPEPNLPRAESLAEVKMPSQPIAVDILGTKTGLSTEGYLQDIHNLKVNIIRQYGEHIPPEIKANIMDKPSVDIAKEYGLYKPGGTGGDSAMGYAGEKLSVDTSGHLVIEHVDGTKDFLTDTQTGGIKQFGGKMFTPETTPKPSMEHLENSGIDESVVRGTTIPETVPAVGGSPIDESVVRGTTIPDVVPSSEGVSGTIDSVYPTHIPYHETIIDVVDNGGSKAVSFGGMEIAHEHAFGTGKILALDDKFQDGAQFRDIRGAFNEVFNKTPADLLGKTPHVVDFEGGKVYIVQGIAGNENAVSVIQNGKEIAKGLVTEKGAHVELLRTPGIRSGFFFADTPYEKAFKFKEVKNIIKSLKMVK